MKTINKKTAWITFNLMGFIFSIVLWIKIAINVSMYHLTSMQGYCLSIFTYILFGICLWNLANFFKKEK